MTSKRKRLISLITLIIIVSLGFVGICNQTIISFSDSWMHTYGTSDSSYISDMIARNNNEFVIRGEIDRKFMILGIDGTGAVLWNHPLHTNFHKMIATSDGGVMFIGTKRGSYDALYLYRIDANNSVMWERSYNPPRSIADRPVYIQFSPDAIQTSDGGVLVACHVIDHSVHQRARTWLARLDNTGSLIWNVSYFLHPLFLPKLLQLPTDEIIITGLNYHEWAPAIVYLNRTGDILWNYTFDELTTPHIEEVFAIRKSGGEIVIGGGSNKEVYLIGIDTTDHSIIWNHTYSHSHSVYISSMIQTSDGGYALAGFITLDADDWDAYLLCTDANGIRLWNRTYGGLYRDKVNALLQTLDKGFILAGTTFSFGIGNNETSTSDAWIFKTDIFGYISPLPKFLEGLMFIGWGLSLGGALVMGIMTADLFLNYRKKHQDQHPNEKIKGNK
ncbi:MAG: hypothetical protein ACFFC7_02760 [Candidatus Hermodarchaeota archaeon]